MVNECSSGGDEIVESPLIFHLSTDVHFYSHMWGEASWHFMLFMENEQEKCNFYLKRDVHKETSKGNEILMDGLVFYFLGTGCAVYF